MTTKRLREMLAIVTAKNPLPWRPENPDNATQEIIAEVFNVMPALLDVVEAATIINACSAEDGRRTPGACPLCDALGRLGDA